MPPFRFPPHRVWPSLLKKWIACRLPLLLTGLLLAALCYLPSRQLKFDQSIENMFAPDDPLLIPFHRLNRTFGANEVVLASYRDDRLLTADGFRRLRQLSDQAAQAPGVAAVQGLANTPLGDAIVNHQNPLARRVLDLFTGYAISADRRTAAVVCLLSPRDRSPVPRAQTVDQLRGIVEQLPEGTLAGEPVMVVDGFRYLERDGRLLQWTSTGLLVLTIVLCFRSARWVVIPIAVVQLTLWMTLALLAVLDLRLSMVSSMLSAIITIVGVATVIHWTIRYREERASGHPPTSAFFATGLALGGPIVSACVTDTVGCASLLLARVGPVQDFGAMTSLGLTLVLVSLALLLPGLSLTGRYDRDPRRSWGEGTLDFGLYRAVDWVVTQPWIVGGLALAIAAFSVAGASRLVIESDFTQNFRADSPLVRSYERIESQLGGAGVWDLILPAPAELDAAYLARVWRLEERLRRECLVLDESGDPTPGLTKIFSLADVVQAVSPLPLATLEKMPPALTTGSLAAMRSFMPHAVHALFGEDPDHPGRHYARVMLRSLERQPASEKKHLIAAVQRIASEEFPPTADAPGAEVTGFFVLLTQLIDSLLRDQWLTFAAATIGMWLVMLVVFRSPLLALLGLVPNVLPVFLMTGLLGWLGIKLNMGAAVIAAFSMGLSVDSSVHYVIDFQNARRRGLSLRDSLDAAHQSAGRAAVFATLALVVGFSALCMSEFVPTIYFGALTGLTMIGGLLGNLFVLPLLLKLTRR